MGDLGVFDNVPFLSRLVFTPQTNRGRLTSFSSQFGFSEFWALLPEQQAFLHRNRPPLFEEGNSINDRYWDWHRSREGSYQPISDTFRYIHPHPAHRREYHFPPHSNTPSHKGSVPSLPRSHSQIQSAHCHTPYLLVAADKQLHMFHPSLLGSLVHMGLRELHTTCK